MTSRPPAHREERLAYERTRLPVEVSSAILRFLAAQGLRGADLATALNVSPAEADEILYGGADLTLSTLATVSALLGARFEITLVPHGQQGL